jgi:hypothetical protein
VTIGEFVATGCGQSKKKAKHCAAKAILDKLLGAQNAGVASPGQPTIPDLAQASRPSLYVYRYWYLLCLNLKGQSHKIFDPRFFH